MCSVSIRLIAITHTRANRDVPGAIGLAQIRQQAPQRRATPCAHAALRHIRTKELVIAKKWHKRSVNPPVYWFNWIFTHSTNGECPDGIGGGGVLSCRRCRYFYFEICELSKTYDICVGRCRRHVRRQSSCAVWMLRRGHCHIAYCIQIQTSDRWTHTRCIVARTPPHIFEI